MRDRSSTAALAAAPLLLVSPALGPCKSELVLVDTDCIEATVFDVEKKDGGVSAAGGSISRGSSDADGKPCPSLTAGDVTFYRDLNGKPGYQGPGDVVGSDPPLEPDEFVSHLAGDVSSPTGEITIGSFSTASPAKGKASAWQVVVTDAAGGESHFSGTF